jgi:GNAT superfamily N-acetyltransferase
VAARRQAGRRTGVIELPPAVTLDGMEVVPHTDAGAFARLARPLLEPDPVRHTSILTVLDGVRTGAFDPTAMLTVHENGGVVGALLRTAGHPALVSAVPPRCAGVVVEALVARDPEVEGVQGPAEEAEVVGVAWSDRTGAGVTVGLRMRLFALDELDAPAGVAGAARAVGPDDARGLDLLARWRAEFDREIGRTWRHAHTARDDVVRAVGTGAGEIVWEVDGEPVAQAAARAVVAGMSRIGPVYTPPEHRGRGYAAAVTAGAARWALGSGARHVLLYTDLANPTTNRLYPRLGFRPRYDALELRFVRG